MVVRSFGDDGDGGDVDDSKDADDDSGEDDDDGNADDDVRWTNSMNFSFDSRDSRLDLILRRT